MRQRELWQQEQQRILEAQQAANRQPPQGYVNQGWGNTPGTQSNVPVRQDIEEWQRQMEAQRIAASGQTEHESVLFGKKRKRDEPAAREEKPFRSRIFGRKKEESDGLTDPEVTEQQLADGTRNRRTVTDQPLKRPETRWTAPEEEAGRRKIREQKMETEPERPEPEQKEQKTENHSEINLIPEDPVPQDIIEERTGSRVRPEPGDRVPEKKPDSPWSRQVQEALDAEKAAKPKDRQLDVPAVQQVIGQEAYEEYIAEGKKSRPIGELWEECDL